MRAPGRTGCVILLFLFLAAAARADYRDSYAAAIRAKDRKDWNAVIGALKAAAAEKPEEGERLLIYGMRYERYLPYYNLGLAYFNTGNCAEAVKALEESDRQGIIRQLAEYRDVQRIAEQCKVQSPRPAQPSPAAPTSPVAPDHNALATALGEAEKETVKAEKSAASVSKLRSDPAVAAILDADSSLRAREARASQDLAMARAVLGDAKSRSDAGKAAAAKEAALRAGQDFEALSAVLTQRRGAAEKLAREKDGRDRERREGQAREAEAQAAARRAFEDVGLKARDARAALAETDRRKPLPASLSGPRSDLASLLAHADRATAATPVAELGQLRDRLERQTLALRKALASAPTEAAAKPSPASKPPEFLIEAATAYFQGDYGKAMKLLAAIDPSDRRAAAQAHLFRTAALYATYVLQGEKDSAMRERCEKDARESRRLDPTIIPNSLAFSPKFASFFLKTAPEKQRG